MVKKRDSNLELFRIISMIIIVAHHYVVNSGLLDCVQGTSLNDILILIFGWGGKDRNQLLYDDYRVFYVCCEG